MAFEKQLPQWKAKGIKPPQNKLDEGWKAQDKPPAAWLNWQMNSTYEALNELQQHAVDGRDVSAVPTPNGIVRLDGEGHLNEQAFADAKSKSIQFKPGIQVVESASDSPIKLESVRGRTLVNLLGRAGSCEDASAFNKKTKLEVSVDTSRKSQGQGSLLLVSTVPEKTFSGVGRSINVNPDSYYVAVAMANNITSKRLRLQIHGMSPSGQFINVDTTGWNKFESLFIRFRPSDVNGTTSVEVQLWIETEGVNAGGCFDALRVYEISKADYDAIGTMTAVQVAERYPYVEGITNVTNPYAIVTGENLLPPFTEWSATGASMPLTIQEDYFAAMGPRPVSDPIQIINYCHDVTAVPHQTYIYRVNHDGVIGVNVFDRFGENLAPIMGNPDVGDWVNKQEISFSLPHDAAVVRLLIGNNGNTTKECKFNNPMLTVGSDSKQFRPQRRSMWAVEAQLAANPVTGADADMLYAGDDGLPYILEKWEKIKLDDKLDWFCMDNKAGFKIVAARKIRKPPIKNTGYVTKFDGTSLMDGWQGVQIDKVDQAVICDNTDQYPDSIILSIANTDSGWGENFTPTQEEIKAYFLGWTMYNGTAGNSPDVPANNLYIGTGTKWWVRRANGVDREWRNATAAIPITMSDEWTPYRLQYLKASTTVTPIEKYEMGMKLTSGTNLVEVGSGIVIREETKPVHNYINAINIAGGSLKHRTIELLEIYKDQRVNRLWKFKSYEWEGEAYQYGEYPITPPPATYHVTYKMLAPTLAASINVKAVANMRGTMAELVDRTGYVERRLCVVETKKANEGAEDWIATTPMHGWVPYDLKNYRTSCYYKNSLGTVRVSGMLTGGSTVAGTWLFVLPAGYRPKYHHIFSVACSDGGSTVSTAALSVAPSGVVSLTRAPANGFLSLAGVEFRAEQ